MPSLVRRPVATTTLVDHGDYSFSKKVTRSVVGFRLVHNETTGAYDDINDEISELGFFSESRDTPGMVERNPIQTLAFLRFILKGAADMSVALGKAEEQRRGLWRRIAAGLQNYVSVLAMSPEDSATVGFRRFTHLHC